MTGPIDDLPRVRELADPAERALGLSRALDAIPDLQKQLRAERQDAILAMRANGMTFVEIGDRLGLHWARVSQIARGISGGTKKRGPKDDAPPAEADGAP